MRERDGRIVWERERGALVILTIVFTDEGLEGSLSPPSLLLVHGRPLGDSLVIGGDGEKGAIYRARGGNWRDERRDSKYTVH
jgi:hypothetical protein